MSITHTKANINKYNHFLLFPLQNKYLLHNTLEISHHSDNIKIILINNNIPDSITQTHNLHITLLPQIHIHNNNHITSHTTLHHHNIHTPLRLFNRLKTLNFRIKSFNQLYGN